MRLLRVVAVAAAPGARLARFACVLAAALVLAVLLRHAYAALLLPAWTFQTRLFLGDSAFLGAALRRAGADEVVQVSALAPRAVPHRGGLRVVYVRVEASTLAGRGILHPLLILSLLALLARDWRHFARLATAAFPFVALTEMLDIPLVLSEQLSWREPIWTRFLDGGGRFALCIAAAAGAHALERSYFSRRGRHEGFTARA